VLNLSDNDREHLAALGVADTGGGQLRSASGAEVDDGTAALLLKSPVDYGGFGDVVPLPAMPLSAPRDRGVPGVSPLPGMMNALPGDADVPGVDPHTITPPRAGGYPGPAEFGFPGPIRVHGPGDLTAAAVATVKADRHDVRHPDTGQYMPRGAGQLGDAGTLPGETPARPVTLSGPGQFGRGYLTGGHQSETAEAARHMPIPHPAEPEDFRRACLEDGQQAGPPASDPGGNNPLPPDAPAAELFTLAAGRLDVNHQTERHDHLTAAVVPHHMPVPDRAAPPSGMRSVMWDPARITAASGRAPGEDR
jgi:hypothetical protein